MNVYKANRRDHKRAKRVVNGGGVDNRSVPNAQDTQRKKAEQLRKARKEKETLANVDTE